MDGKPDVAQSPEAGWRVVEVRQRRIRQDFADHMPTGVSYYEQMVWDLEQRGNANIDIPVIILGVNAEGPHPEQPD